MAQDKEQQVEGGPVKKPDDNPGEHQPDQPSSPDAPPPGQSGVADEDPLSAHPT